MDEVEDKLRAALGIEEDQDQVQDPDQTGLETKGEDGSAESTPRSERAPASKAAESAFDRLEARGAEKETGEEVELGPIV